MIKTPRQILVQARQIQEREKKRLIKLQEGAEKIDARHDKGKESSLTGYKSFTDLLSIDIIGGRMSTLWNENEDKYIHSYGNNHIISVSSDCDSARKCTEICFDEESTIENSTPYAINIIEKGNHKISKIKPSIILDYYENIGDEAGYILCVTYQINKDETYELIYYTLDNKGIACPENVKKIIVEYKKDKQLLDEFEIDLDDKLDISSRFKSKGKKLEQALELSKAAQGNQKELQKTM